MKEIESALEHFLLNQNNEALRKTCFQRAWQHYYPKITIFVSTSFNFHTEEIEELVQDIFFKVYKNLHMYSKRFSFSTWIYTVARNICTDALRRQKRNKIIYLDNTVLAESFHDNAENDPERRVIREEDQNEVRSCLNRLHEIDRQICFLRLYEEMQYKQIASILEIPAGTVKYRYFMAKQRLKDLLEEPYEGKTTRF
jgi:RNA polymerase sigma-70 factor (ECF subfamily)